MLLFKFKLSFVLIVSFILNIKVYLSSETCSFRASDSYEIGEGDSLKENSLVSIEIDLRSEDEKHREIRFLFDGKQEECYFYDIPLSVKVGVCNLLSFFFYSLFFFRSLLILIKI